MPDGCDCNSRSKKTAARGNQSQIANGPYQKLRVLVLRVNDSATDGNARHNESSRKFIFQHSSPPVLRVLRTTLRYGPVLFLYRVIFLSSNHVQIPVSSSSIVPCEHFGHFSPTLSRILLTAVDRHSGHALQSRFKSSINMQRHSAQTQSLQTPVRSSISCRVASGPRTSRITNSSHGCRRMTRFPELSVT